MRRLTRLVAAVPVVLGATVIIGYWTQQPALTQIVAGQAAMVFNTALCFVLIGAALLLPVGTRHRLSSSCQVALGLLVMVLAASVLSQDLFDIELGVDSLLFDTWPAAPNPHPGRMAPNTALGLILSGLSLTLLNKALDRWAALVLLLVFSVITIGLTGLAGYALSLELLYSWHAYTRMAITTAGGFIVVGIALLLNLQAREWYQQLYHGKEDQRVTLIAGLIMASVTFAASLAGFVMLEAPLEASLKNNLRATLLHRQAEFAKAVDDALSATRTITNHRELLAGLRNLSTGRSDALALETIQDSTKDLLASGFSAVAFYDLHDTEIYSAGNFTRDAGFQTVLQPSRQGSLLWNKRLFLRLRVNLMKDSRLIGAVLTERALPEAAYLLTPTSDNLGTTAAVDICRPAGDGMQCLPTRAFLIQVHTYPEDAK